MKLDNFPRMLTVVALILSAAACSSDGSSSDGDIDSAAKATSAAETSSSNAETSDATTTETSDESVTGDTTNTSSEATSTVHVGAYTLDGETYTDTGVELVFASEGECQTWSRTAQGDGHDSESHQHFNAAANVSFDSEAMVFTWTEYGPELDQASIEATCSAGVDGFTKTVDDSSYYQDKPNLYLKITDVVAS